MVDHYEELGVDPSATGPEIRAAYLQLARRHHPDRLSDVPIEQQTRSAERMARINMAWSVLSDPGRRRAYDDGRRGDHRPDDARPRAADVRDLGDTFRPFEEVEDEIDPRLLDDRGVPVVRRSLALLPAAFAGAGAGMVLLGAMLGFVGLLAFGFAALGLSAVSFLVVPLVALTNASRADRDR